MTSHYNSQSWRDDFESNIHPTIAYALHSMRTSYAAEMANRNAHRWPFPLTSIPLDRKPAPRHPDPEDAPL